VLGKQILKSFALRTGIIVYDFLHSDVKERLPKCWVKFQGILTVQIEDSYNVAAVVDLAVGRYRVDWDIDFGTIAYAVAGLAVDYILVVSAYTAGYTIVESKDYTGVNTDSEMISVIALGNQ